MGNANCVLRLACQPVWIDGVPIMKLATILLGGQYRVAIVAEDQPARLLIARWRSVGDVIRAGVAPHMLEIEREIEGADHPILAAPIPLPARNIFCVGKNYRDHVHEFAQSGFDAGGAADAVPAAAIIFSKVPDCVIATGEPIMFDPAISASIDYEGELAVIIGTGGYRISRAQAMAHVWGYTIVNDVTARDVQSRHQQWLIGKSFDTFCPMGPWAVTADEIDLANTTLRTWVNGEKRQDANTADLIFDVPAIIEALSAGITLKPGDIIATGTPAGVGIGFKPPRYLQNGDQVAVEISGIGRLENEVRTV